MKQSDELFYLIRSMSRSEKGYFRKYASMHKRQKNHFLVLFDILEKQEQYDEETLILALKRKKAASNYKVHKHYLFHILVRSLSQYYSTSDETVLVADILKDIAILRKKGLLNSGLKLLEKGKALAKKHEKLHLLIAIIKEQISLLLLKGSGIDAAESISVLYAEMETATRQLLNAEQYRLAYIRVSSSVQRNNYGFLSDKEHETLDKVINEAIFSSFDKAITFESQCLYYLVHGSYARAKDDLAGSHFYNSALVKHLEGKGIDIPGFKSRYFTALGNLLNSCIKLRRKKEFRHYYEKLNTLDVSDLDNGEVRHFLTLSNLELNYYMDVEDPHRCLGLLPKMEEGMGRLCKKIPLFQQNTLCFNIALVYFLCAEYKVALRWLNKVLTSDEKKMGEGLHSVAKLINLLVHYKLDNTELLENLLQSYERDTKEERSSLAFEADIIKYLKDDLRDPSHETRYNRIRMLYLNLCEASLAPPVNIQLEVFNFTDWVRKQAQDEIPYLRKVY